MGGDSFEGDDAAELFKEVDVNHDGAVQYDNFIAFLLQEDNEVVEMQNLGDEAKSETQDSLSRREQLLNAADHAISRILSESPSESQGPSVMRPRQRDDDASPSCNPAEDPSLIPARRDANHDRATRRAAITKNKARARCDRCYRWCEGKGR